MKLKRKKSGIRDKVLRLNYASIHTTLVQNVNGRYHFIHKKQSFHGRDESVAISASIDSDKRLLTRKIRIIDLSTTE